METATATTRPAIIQASQTTVPAFESTGLRWVVAHDGAPRGATELAADHGTLEAVDDAVAWLTKCGAVGIRVIDMSA
jgi:hypothetical protein